LSISAAALSLPNPLPARPAAPARAEDRAAQERVFALPPEARSPEASPRAPIKMGKTAPQAPATESPETGRDNALSSTESPQDKGLAETASKSENASGHAQAVISDPNPAVDANVATETQSVALAMAAPSQLPVPLAAEMVMAVGQLVQGIEARVPNAAVSQASDALVSAPAPSGGGKAVVAALPAGLTATDETMVLSQQPAAQAALTAGDKGVSELVQGAEQPQQAQAALTAGDKGPSELVQRAEQPQQAQAALMAGASAEKPADGPPVAVTAGDKGASELAQRAEQPQAALTAGASAEKPADGPPVEVMVGDKGASELAQRAEQPQQAQAAQAAAHRPGEGPEPGTPVLNLQSAANPDALPPPLVQPGRPEGAEAYLAKPIPPGAVPVEIGLRALQGAREFQIRLDPAELGRVDVRLEIGDDKSVSAKIIVDRVETLHLLQREAKTLERAFEQAGLKSSDNGIDITLRDHGQQSNQQRGEAFRDDISGRTRKAAAAPIVLPADMSVRRSLHLGALDRSI
jgi:flagellar hook-length control protein FliK